LPERGTNVKTFTTRLNYGSIGTAKAEVNGWGLMKSLHDNGLIKLNEEDYGKCVKNIEMYTKKVIKLEKISDRWRLL
jgi:hypothetical protein